MFCPDSLHAIPWILCIGWILKQVDQAPANAPKRDNAAQAAQAVHKQGKEGKLIHC